MSFQMNVKKLNEKAILPTYGSAFAAGADLYACEEGEVTVAAGETKLIHTGLAMEIPEGLVGLIYARSGLASKKGLAPANKVGMQKKLAALCTGIREAYQLEDFEGVLLWEQYLDQPSVSWS